MKNPNPEKSAAHCSREARARQRPVKRLTRRRGHRRASAARLGNFALAEGAATGMENYRRFHTDNVSGLDDVD